MCFVCLTAYSPSCGNVTRSYLSVRWKRKKKKKTRKTIREYGIVIVVEVFLELHLRDRQHTVNTHNSRNLLNMIVQHFPAYNTPVLGLWNKNRCLFFHRHSLSAYSLFLSRLPFGQKKKMVQRSRLYRHFLLSSLANSNFLWNFRRHFRWRLTQFTFKKETKNKKKKGEKNVGIFVVFFRLVCACYTWFNKDVFPSVGVHASSGVCPFPNTHKTVFFNKYKNEIFPLLFSSVVHDWSGFILPGNFNRPEQTV